MAISIAILNRKSHESLTVVDDNADDADFGRLMTKNLSKLAAETPSRGVKRWIRRPALLPTMMGSRETSRKPVRAFAWSLDIDKRYLADKNLRIQIKWQPELGGSAFQAY
ncbi:hypothetical protein C8J56DRAFT_1057498 [Mycena floridula]|nr:hypothetical protein C8J56DRAFT_1057498 [Mycena floridula]